MENLSRRGFLKGAAVAVPAAAVAVALPQVVAAAPVQYEYLKGITMDAPWSGAEIIPVYSELPECGDPKYPMYYINFKTETISLVGPCNGNVLYNHLKKRWRDTNAIRFEFPIMAITPELYEMQGGWKIRNVHHLQNASLEDDGYGNRVLGCISLGQVFKEQQMLWAPGDQNVRGHMRAFSRRGHVNEGVIFPSRAEKFFVRYGTETKDMSVMCGFGDLSRFTYGPVRFPVFQQINI